MLQHVPRTDHSTGVDAKERRRLPRYPISASAEAVEIRSHTRMGGRVSDISEGGCYFEVMSPFAVSSEVNLRIFNGDTTLAARGKVLYSTGGMGMGLAFTTLEPEQRVVLERWIGELSGDRTPEPSPPPIEPETPRETTANDEQRNVLNELIITLIRKHVLTDAEGKALLQKLLL